MLNRQPVNSLKGIGEKTGKLFEKLGVVTIDAVSYTHLNTIWTTPTGVSKGFMTQDMMVKMDLNGNILMGRYKPCLLYTSNTD